MNDKVKGIIIGGVVLAALGGTLAVLKFTGVEDEVKAASDSSSIVSDSSEAPDESVQLISREETEVKEVKVTNEFGGYTFTGKAASGKENAGIVELKGLGLNVNKVNDIGIDSANLKAYRLAEHGAADLRKYGLTAPQASFDITFTDGEQRSFLIGNKAPDEQFCYVCEKGSSDVYMINESLLRNFFEPIEHFVNRTLVEAQTEDTPEFGKLSISRKDLDYDIVFEQDHGTYERSSMNMISGQVMTAPIFAYLDGTNSTDLLYNMYGLTAKETMKVHPSEDDLKEYGLDDPACVVEFSGEGYDYILKIGNGFHDENEQGEEITEASAYFCTIEGVDGRDCIFKIDATALPYLTVVPGDVISSLMTWNIITDVENVSFKGLSDDVFEIKTTGEGDDAELEGVTCGGKELDVPTFKSFYQFLLTCPTKNGIYFEDPSGEAYLTISINCKDGHSDVIELYKDTDRRSIVKLNGRTSYRIQSKWVDRLIKNIEAVKNGEEIEQDY